MGSVTQVVLIEALVVLILLPVSVHLAVSYLEGSPVGTIQPTSQRVSYLG